MSATPLWRDRRLASLVVLIAIAVGSVIVMTDAALSWRREGASLAELERRTQLLETRAAEITAMARPEAEGDGLSGIRLLLEGDTPGLVSAEFQRLFGEEIEAAGAAVRAIDAPETEPVGEVRDVDGGRLVRIRLEADVEVMEQTLPDLLLAIETALPIMVVDSMTLRANRRVDTVAGDVWVSAADRPLMLRIAVSSFYVQAVP
jgi:hypothetical protein